MLRNELGLALLFTSLILLNKSDIGQAYPIVASLAMASVALTHSLVAIIMFTILAVMIVYSWIKKRSKQALKLLILSTPAILLFLLTVYAGYIMPSIPPELNVLHPEGEWLNFFGFSSYIDMSAKMLSFLIYCYLPLLPLVIKGAKSLKNRQIQTWTIWSLIATFSPIVSTLAYRWLLMLTYPLAFYATETLWNIKSNNNRLHTSTILGALLAILTIGFIVMPSASPFPYYTVPQFQNYIPSSMLQNTIPQSDCQHVTNSLNWLKNNMHTNSILLTHTAFHGWALLTLDADKVIPYGYGNPESTAKNSTKQGYEQIYLIWWTEGKGWHGLPTIPSSFGKVYQSGNIAIYLYENTINTPTD